MPNREPKPLAVACSSTTFLGVDDLRAYCKYHGLNFGTIKRRELAGHIRMTLADLGYMGLEEQINQGLLWLQDGQTE